MKKLALLVLALLPGPAMAATVDDAEAVRMVGPQEEIVSPAVPADERAAMTAAADAFYGFWTNGSPALLEAAIAPTFTDRTLPPGRPQGPQGPAAASAAFLAAVPDLTVTVVQRLVVGDRVVSHLRFTGHFTGTFAGRQGEGQPVDFIATDILRIEDGRITDNWHLEDNLTFLRQIGAID
ncbi:ester cyclase [Acuticoccus sp. I52.16.1]|uniref:ester cyclase n=1 Tax=Acuticoccus sp. I52.16.1 TaxID=2928472 RepID=UPI001FD54E65|nr:ester cyclase [Acuticoccus sp. I52.16.1]UOM36676.1 ester cyclase [Acuticoccus sp. I52.16.1]